MSGISTVRVGSNEYAEPGARSTVDTQSAQAATILGRGTLAVIGKASNGKPGVVLEFPDMSRARQYFWLDDADGDLGLRLAARYAYEAAAKLKGKPQRFLTVKVNPDTGGTAQLLGPNGALVNLTSRDYGAHVNGIRVQVGPGTNGGASLVIREGVLKPEVVDGLGAKQALTVKYTGGQANVAAVTTSSAGLQVDYIYSDSGENAGEVQTGWTPGVATVASASAADVYQKVTVFGLNGSNVPIKETLALNGTTPVVGAVSFTKVTGAQIDGLTVGSVTVKDSAVATSMTFAASLLASLAAGKLKLASSSTTDKAIAVQVTGYGAGGLVLVETIVLNGTATVQGVQTFAKLLKVAIAGTTAGTLTVSDTASTALVTLAAGTNKSAGFANTKGLALITAIPQAGTIIANATGAALDIVLRGIDAAGAQAVERLAAIDGANATSTTVWSAIQQVELGATSTAASVALLGKMAALAATMTAKQAAAALNGLGCFTCTSYQDGRLLGALDYVASQDCKATAVASLFSQTSDIVDWINSFSQFLTAARVANASGLPVVTPNPVAVSGGATVDPTAADWAAAFDLLKAQEVNVIAVLSDDDAVRAMAGAHADWADGTFERFLHVGLAADQTAQQIDDATIVLNNSNVVVQCWSASDYDDQGVLRLFGPPMLALQCAAQQVATPVGTPLTRKQLSVQAISHATLVPEVDAEQLLRLGVTFPRKRQTGISWVRSITSYRASVNLALQEMSAKDSTNECTRNLREFLDALVTGTTSVDLPLDAIKRDAESYMIDLRTARMCTDFDNLTVAEDGDTVLVDLDLVPVLPRNFTKIGIHVALSRTAA